MNKSTTFVTDEQFHEIVLKTGNTEDSANEGLDEGYLLRKQFIADEIKAAGGSNSRVLNFTISTETADRYGDVIKANGWDLTNYNKNPVVLFAHDSRNPPVGRALSLEIKGKKLKASAEFMDNEIDTSGFSDMIYRMLKGGFLKATSVGFMPRAFEFMKTKDEEGNERITGLKFTEQELLEFSVVPVPANPEALIGAKSVGIDISPLEGWFEEALDQWSEFKNGLFVPKSFVETLYRTARDNGMRRKKVTESPKNETQETKMAEDAGKQPEDVKVPDQAKSKAPEVKDTDADAPEVGELREFEDILPKYHYEVNDNEIHIKFSAQTLPELKELINIYEQTKTKGKELADLIREEVDKAISEATIEAKSEVEAEVKAEPTKTDVEVKPEQEAKQTGETEVVEITDEMIQKALTELPGMISLAIQEEIAGIQGKVH